MRTSFTRYHGSSHEFSFPNYSEVTKNSSNHDNSVIGLWVGVKQNLATSFGSLCYELEIQGTTADITIDELVKWSRTYTEKSDYVKKRDEFLLLEIDYVNIVESNGISYMGIIINFESIKSFKKISNNNVSIPNVTSISHVTKMR